VTQKSIDEVQHLTSNIQTRSYPTQGVEALHHTTGPGVILVGIMELVLYGILFRDVIRQRNMKENEEFEDILIGLIFRKEKIIRRKMLNLLCGGSVGVVWEKGGKILHI
jgi:hypothetical protein